MLGINKVLAFVRRQVGLRTDTASATGSLHAKAKDIKDYLSGIKPQGFLKTSFSSSTTSFQTALDVSGSGSLDGLAITANASAAPNIRITIDGNIIYNGSTLSGLNANVFCSPGVLFPFSLNYEKNWNYIEEAQSTTLYKPYTPMAIKFKSSLKIEIKGNNTSTVTTHMGYSLDS